MKCEDYLHSHSSFIAAEMSGGFGLSNLSEYLVMVIIIIKCFAIPRFKE